MSNGFFSRSGSPGTDLSVNPAAIPLSGYVQIQQVPAAPRRNFIEVQNQSTYLIQLVRDDGTGANQTTIMLGAAAVAGGQGSGWTSDTFKGRLTIYAPSSTAQVAVYVD